jgi:hypothetical protein
LETALDAFGHPLNVLADRYQVGGGGAGQVAVEADPVDRAGKAMIVVLVGGREASGEARSTEVKKVPLVEHLPELFGKL